MTSFYFTAVVVCVFILCGTTNPWLHCDALVIIPPPQKSQNFPALEEPDTPDNTTTDLTFPDVTVIAVFNNHTKARHVGEGIQLQDTVPILILQCQASYPVEWVYLEHFASTSDNLRSWHINASRSIGSNLWNNSEFRFESNFTFIYRAPAEPRQQVCRRAGALEGPVTKVHAAIHGRYLRLTVIHDTIYELPVPRYGNNTNCTYNLQLYKGKNGCEDKICCDTTLRADEYVGSKFFHRGCSNQANCRSLFQPTTPCFTISEASLEPKTTIDGICMGGSEMAPYGTSGFIVCGDADVDSDSVAVHYFTSVLDLDLCTKITRHEDRNKTRPRVPKLYLNKDIRENKLQHEMITVCPMENQILYVGEQVEFKCVATYNFFANGFHFVLRRNKSGLITEEVIAGNETSLYSKNVPEKEIIMSSIQLISTITLNESSISDVVCAGPVWDSFEWVNKTQRLKVIKPTEPKFWNGDVEEIILDGDTIITCNVSAGDPAPRLIWYSATVRFDFMNILTTNAATIALEIKFDSWRQDLSRVSCQAHQDRLGVNAMKEKIFVLKRMPDHPFPTVHVLSVTAGFLIVLLLVLCLIGRMIFKKTRDRLRSLNEGEIQEFFQGRQANEAESETVTEANAWKDPYDYTFEVSPRNVSQESEIDRGEFGKIYLGYWTKPNSETVSVALKKNLAYGTMVDFKASLYELKLLIFMGHHKSIVRLLGAITSNVRKREVYVMLEYCKHGALKSYLVKNKEVILSGSNPQFRAIDQNRRERAPPGTNRRHHRRSYYLTAEDILLNSIIRMGLLTWVEQILEGLVFLESKKVIHGDLAARNILLDSYLNAKICDFGMSHQVTREFYKYTTSPDVKKPFNSSAPEVLERCEYSFKSDVYSFGVLLWEIFSLGEVPWALVPSNRMLATLQRGECLGIPKVSYTSENGASYQIQLIPIRIYEKMMECWLLEPRLRPTFKELQEFFTELREQGTLEEPTNQPTAHGTNRTRAESLVL